MANERNETTGGNGRVDQAEKEAKRRAAEGASRAHDTVDRVASRAHDAVDRAAGYANRTAENLGERGEQFAELTEEYAATARSYIQAHPLATLGMAVAAGFLISKLLSAGDR